MKTKVAVKIGEIGFHKMKNDKPQSKKEKTVVHKGNEPQNTFTISRNSLT
ncbi:hypothetical protein [Metabacillus endolithicus]|nr:hypothetical protein [Metabacillus endolithicus]UPG65407.1 hypothetical protein MVE64_10805 [Metabacillus endolithicus]